MQNNNYVYYRESQKEEKKPNYLLTILGAIFMVECIVMLGIWLSALWYLEYGV